MKYRKGFKYQLAESIQFQTNIFPDADIINDFVILRTSGILELCLGFAWDGASGPVVDRKSNLRGSAGHDGLYRLMRKGLLSHQCWEQADQCFGKWLKEDGAWGITVWIDMTGLKIANGAAAHPDNIAKIYEV